MDLGRRIRIWDMEWVIDHEQHYEQVFQQDS